MRAETRARLLVALLLLAVLAGAGIALSLPGQAPLLHGRIAESGGWLPDNLKAEVGKPLTLRLTSDDVVHGFAVGQMEMAPVDILPGEISEVTLTFDKPGRYTFYCTRWCSINHWRMRGVIEVSDPQGLAPAEPQALEPPLYLSLGLDIDAPRQVEAPLPGEKPVAEQGKALGAGLPEGLATREYYRSHSPEQLYTALKETPGLSDLPNQDLWNLVAAVWQANISPQSLESGEALYAANCAACHGEQGRGDGVFAAELAHPAGEHAGQAPGEMTQAPADFTDAARMLSASPALLQGKIIRGGMGTGMPYWGPIFTEEQTWDLVAYLWTFQFDLEENE